MPHPSPKPIIEAFHAAGIEHAFGLPGTQNLETFEALRTSGINTLVATHELGAAFMANGYYRASGKVALVATIPGPGFTFALTGLAEAWLDSAALVHLTVAPASQPGNTYQLQAIDQAAMAAPVVKAVLGIEEAVGSIPAQAVGLAQSGEPGPVTVQLGAPGSRVISPDQVTSFPEGEIDEIAALVNSRRRVVLLVGQGAAGTARTVAELAEKIGAAVVTTTSARGVVSEDHPLSLGFEMGGTDPGPLNQLVAASDLVVALGCKFSHNGSRGFGLDIPPEKLVHVDSSSAVIGANYPARIGAVARCEEAVPALLERTDPADGWSDSELAEWRRLGSAESWPNEPQPVYANRLSGEDLMTALRDAIQPDAIVLTDSGRHQMLVRRWFRVLAPRGLIIPTNLQSMGFAIPAAIGARLAAPDREVVAIVGDGGLLMSALELRTAATAAIPVKVIVINDGAFGMLKHDQLASYGTATSSTLPTPNLAKLADALGVSYARVGSTEPHGDLEAGLAMPGPTLIEVPTREATSMRIVQAKGVAKRLLRRG